MVLKRRKIECSDGHFAHSKGEQELDEFLTERGIKHRIHLKIRGTNCICDFWLTEFKVGIEFAGVRMNKAYNERMKDKKAQYDRWRIPILWVYPETTLDDSLIGDLIELAKKDIEQINKNFKLLSGRL